MKKIMLIFIFILAICLVSPIAASDNTTVTDDIKVSFNDTVYHEDLGSIDVELPENVSGNLKATINDVEFYNENVSSSVSIPITIPQKAIPTIVPNRITDHATYHINILFNNTIVDSNHTLKVMRTSPDYVIPGFPSEILKDDPEGYVTLYMPESADGELKVYIDGEFAFNMTSRHFNFLNASPFNSLELGSHNVTISYSGDSYYRKFTKSFNFTVVDMEITIPVNMVLDHDDCVTAKTIENRDGTVTVYVDGKKVHSEKLDKYGEFLYSMFDDVTCGEHLINVTYTAGSFTRSKSMMVNVTYDVDIWDFTSFIYGEENEIIITVPTDFNKNLIKMEIDGKEIKNFNIDDSGWIEIDVSGLEGGNHTFDFAFSGGDDKYNYPYAESLNFTVKYSIMYPRIFDERSTVYLALPDSAKGNLEVYINGKLYKSQKLSNGAASVNINTLSPGRYNMSARYTGSDFNVSDVEDTLRVYPTIITPGEMYCGDDKSIVVRMVSTAKGKVIFDVNGKNYTVDVKNGKAVLSLKNFKKGLYDDIQATYVGADGQKVTVYSGVDILASKIALKNMKVTTTGVKVKVAINGKVAKNTYVTFKVDKKTKKVKTDKNGYATIRLNPGKHTITATFKTAKATKTFKVPSLALSSVKVKKSAKKVVLTAKLAKKLKNKVIKFKFNGKTLKVKTNSKGIAKATFKTSTLKVAKKVSYSATYKKETVKKSVTVKR